MFFFPGIVPAEGFPVPEIDTCLVLSGHLSDRLMTDQEEVELSVTECATRFDMFFIEE